MTTGADERIPEGVISPARTAVLLAAATLALGACSSPSFTEADVRACGTFVLGYDTFNGGNTEGGRELMQQAADVARDGKDRGLAEAIDRFRDSGIGTQEEMLAAKAVTLACERLADRNV